MIELPLKLQYRTSPTDAWQDSDWKKMDHALAEQILWCERNGYCDWCEYRLVIDV